MNESFKQQLREEFDLSAPMAAWIVFTHIFVLACPLALMWAVAMYSDLLPEPFANSILVRSISGRRRSRWRKTRPIDGI